MCCPTLVAMRPREKLSAHRSPCAHMLPLMRLAHCRDICRWYRAAERPIPTRHHLQASPCPPCPYACFVFVCCYTTGGTGNPQVLHILRSARCCLCDPEYKIILLSAPRSLFSSTPCPLPAGLPSLRTALLSLHPEAVA